jgi:hypothetical protein
MIPHPPFKTGQKLLILDGDRKIETILRGWTVGKVVIVDTPEGGFHFADKKQVEGELFRSSGAAATFEFEPLGAMPEFNLFCFSYPTKFVGAETRRSNRFEITLPVTIHKTIGSPSVGIGVISDLSQEGCCLLCNFPFDVNSHFAIELFLPGINTPVSLTTIVRSSRRLKAKQYEYGLWFDLESSKEVKNLTLYLNRVSQTVGVK